MGLHRYRTAILTPLAAHRRLGHLTPESSRARVLLLKGNLPDTRVTTQHRQRGVVADTATSHTSNDEESGHKPTSLMQSSNQAEADRTGLVTKEIRTSIGVREEDGVTLVMVETSDWVGTTQSKLREVVNVELEEALDHRAGLVRHQLKVHETRRGHDGHHRELTHDAGRVAR